MKPFARTFAATVLLLLPVFSMAGDKEAKPASEAEKRRQKILEAGQPGEFPTVAWPDRLKKETAHYNIQTNAPELTAKYVMLLMEQLYAFYSDRLKCAPREKMNVFIFATRADFVRESAAAGRPIDPSVGGYFLTTSDASKRGLYVPWVEQGSLSPTAVLMHEGFHQFFHAAFRTGDPIWLNEGLAVYFECSKFDGDKVTDAYISASRLRHLQRILLEGANDSLQVLLDTPRKAFNVQQYCEAWGFIYWLVWGQKDAAKRTSMQLRLCTYLSKVSDPKNQSAAAFERITELKLKDIEPEWKQWILALKADDEFGGLGEPRKRK